VHLEGWRRGKRDELRPDLLEKFKSLSIQSCFEKHQVSYIVFVEKLQELSIFFSFLTWSAVYSRMRALDL
jgi:hypothetical protein